MGLGLGARTCGASAQSAFVLSALLGVPGRSDYRLLGHRVVGNDDLVLIVSMQHRIAEGNILYLADFRPGRRLNLEAVAEPEGL